MCIIKYVEPLGLTKPRFSGNTHSLTGFSHYGGGAVAMFCASQGFPPPKFK